MLHTNYDEESDAPDDPLPLTGCSSSHHFNDLAYQCTVRKEEEEVSSKVNDRRISRGKKPVEERDQIATNLDHAQEAGKYEHGERGETGILSYFDSIYNDDTDCPELAPLLDAEVSAGEPSSFWHEEPVVVMLLQSTLRSSQFQRYTRSWFPLSGHWAIEIRGEVFELNRTVP